MNESYKVLKCGDLYVEDLIFDGYDKLQTLRLTENISNAKRIQIGDRTYDSIETRYSFLTVKEISISEK